MNWGHFLATIVLTVGVLFTLAAMHDMRKPGWEDTLGLEMTSLLIGVIMIAAGVGLL